MQDGSIRIYIQDDWKVTRNLTINAGIRYDLQWFADNPYGAQSLYIPSLQKVIVFNTAYPNNSLTPTIPAFQSLTELAPAAGMSSSLWGYLGQDTNNVAPRLGFAYQPMQNTVIRGAFGIFYNQMADVYEETPAFSNLPFQGSETSDSPREKPTITMSAPFASTGAFSANPNVNAQAPTVTPYTEQYNLTVEHDFGKGIGTRISYVGQNNRKQNSDGTTANARDLNLPVPSPGAVQPKRAAQPFASILLFNEPIFHSSLNSLQAGLHKQYRGGLMVNAEYQWTRVLGTESFMSPRAVNDSYGEYRHRYPAGPGSQLLLWPAIRRGTTSPRKRGAGCSQTCQWMEGVGHNYNPDWPTILGVLHKQLTGGRQWTGKSCGWRSTLSGAQIPPTVVQSRRFHSAHQLYLWHIRLQHDVGPALSELGCKP